MQQIKSSQVQVVRMRSCDICPALEILVECGLEYWSYNDFASELQREDSFAIVGKFEKRVVGFCLARLIIFKRNTISKILETDANLPKGQCSGISGEELRPECEIYNIAVKREFQHRGVGGRLLNQLTIIIKEYSTESIWLEVRESNTAALNFYQKNNFNRMYIRKNFYTNPFENAIVMRRNLSLDAAVK